MNNVLMTILIVFAGIGFTISGTLIVRKIFGHEHLSRHNEVAGFLYAVIGVIYAVLLAFVVIVVWEDFQEADAYVDEEAKIVSELYQTVNDFENDAKDEILSNVKLYTETVINEDWKLMCSNTALGQFLSMPSNQIYSNLRESLSSYQPISDKDYIWYDKAVDAAIKLDGSRYQRYYSTKLSVPEFIWVVIIFGGFLTIIYAMLFSSENLWSQLIMLSILSMSITLVIFLIYALDHPYRGLITVTSESFEMILKSMK